MGNAGAAKEPSSIGQESVGIAQAAESLEELGSSLNTSAQHAEPQPLTESWVQINTEGSEHA